MFIVPSYGVAIFFCIITMLCWGSWANTQKLAEKTWRFELFYWDYVIGIVLDRGLVRHRASCVRELKFVVFQVACVKMLRLSFQA